MGFIPPDKDPDEGMIREGSTEGMPTVRFCLERRCNYHLNLFGERKYHGVPEDFRFDGHGILHSDKSNDPDPHAGPPADKELT